MKYKVVKYGRTIEVGKFGGGRPYGKVWFGWEVELEEGDKEYEVMAELLRKADDTEVSEREEFEERTRPPQSVREPTIPWDPKSIFNESKGSE